MPCGFSAVVRNESYSLVAKPSGGRKLLTDSDKQFLPVGTRCRLSVLGIKRFPRLADDHCTVIGKGKTKNQVRVKFVGKKTPQTLHRSYLEMASHPASRKAPPS
jgi:hypothetical protein